MIFTVGPTHRFKLNQMMKDFDVHFVPLLDVGVSIHDSNAMNMGKQMDVFLKNPNNNSQYYIGNVWPGDVHFVDFLHPRAS